jgi:hypothetical protein
MTFLQGVLSSPGFLHHLNEHDNAQISEDNSDLEDVDTIPDLVFNVERHLDGPYERVDGLVAYPDLGTFELHSFRPTRSDCQTEVSGHEANIRAALRIRECTLLVTEAQEPDWKSDSTAQLFTKWAPLEPRSLNAGPSFVQSLSERYQQKYDAANFEVQYGGTGISVPGMIGLIRFWLTPEDIIDLYMATQRTLHVQPNIPETSTYLLEKELFNTTKYSGYCTFFTVITYGRGDYGAIELYEITQDAHCLAKSITPVAAAKSVPKTILRSLKKQPKKIVLLQKRDKIRYFCAGKQPAPLLVRVETHNARVPNVEWRDLGQAWRRALRITENSSHEGLVATIPQMMAFLHRPDPDCMRSLLRLLKSSVCHCHVTNSMVQRRRLLLLLLLLLISR